PYLQYAGACIRSIGRKAEAEGVSAAELATATISLDQPAERELALSILGFADVLAEVAAGSQPHRLCSYLFDLRSEEHTSVLRSRFDLVCRLLLEKKKSVES